MAAVFFCDWLFSIVKDTWHDIVYKYKLDLMMMEMGVAGLRIAGGVENGN